METNMVKCPNCGAPIKDGRCTYCNFMVPQGKTPSSPQKPHPISNQKANVRANNYKRVAAKKKKPGKLKVILWVFIGLLILGFIGSISESDTSESESENTAASAESNSSESNSVWAKEPTDISEFDYYLDGEEIYIKSYNGKNKKVRISPTYTIDEKEYHVAALVDGTFALENIDSVIVPEGTRSVEGNTFNSCGVRFVYLPASLTEVPQNFWGYFHKVQKIYYGGTEEQWRQICQVDRSDLDVVEIVYEANGEELQ
ncbi:MAG: hypothetical protein IJJ38_06945 [Lachnospiraceae bacterium]|nr:hypothetical protein [Lachnospiraceae bacterium]